ncbi:hypothetical protein ACFCVO_09245 [Agromyces sp. NPDC056379]|uniref:hypothetical protein n=1 Tax=unclassified Agromyces TaxID=2639701 RepID=UPI0035E0C0C3
MTDARDPAGSGADKRAAGERRRSADDDLEQEESTDGDDPNDLEADIAVEADSVETLDPENPPA